MKSYKAILLPLISLLLVSCTMVKVDVNPAPPTPNETPDTSSEVEKPSDTTSEDASSSTSEEPSESTSSSTSSETVFIDLSFEEAKPVLNEMMNYLKSEQYQEPHSFYQRNELKGINKETNKVIDYQDNKVALNKELMQYQKELKGFHNGHQNNYFLQHIYKDNNINNNRIIDARLKINNQRSYTTTACSEENEHQVFNETTKISEFNIKEKTLTAIDTVLKAEEPIKKYPSKVRISNEEPGKIDIQIDYKLDKKIGPFDVLCDANLKVLIEDYKIYYQHLEYQSSKLHYILNDRYSFAPYEYNSYPDLSDYTCLD